MMRKREGIVGVMKEGIHRRLLHRIEGREKVKKMMRRGKCWEESVKRVEYQISNVMVKLGRNQSSFSPLY